MSEAAQTFTLRVKTTAELGALDSAIAKEKELAATHVQTARQMADTIARPIEQAAQASQGLDAHRLNAEAKMARFVADLVDEGKTMEEVYEAAAKKAKELADEVHKAEMAGHGTSDAAHWAKVVGQADGSNSKTAAKAAAQPTQADKLLNDLRGVNDSAGGGDKIAKAGMSSQQAAGNVNLFREALGGSETALISLIGRLGPVAAAIGGFATALKTAWGDNEKVAQSWANVTHQAGEVIKGTFQSVIGKGGELAKFYDGLTVTLGGESSAQKDANEALSKWVQTAQRAKSEVDLLTVAFKKASEAQALNATIAETEKQKADAADEPAKVSRQIERDKAIAAVKADFFKDQKTQRHDIAKINDDFDAKETEAAKAKLEREDKLARQKREATAQHAEGTAQKVKDLEQERKAHADTENARLRMAQAEADHKAGTGTMDEAARAKEEFERIKKMNAEALKPKDGKAFDFEDNQKAIDAAKAEADKAAQAAKQLNLRDDAARAERAEKQKALDLEQQKQKEDRDRQTQADDQKEQEDADKEIAAREAKDNTAAAQAKKALATQDELDAKTLEKRKHRMGANKAASADDEKAERDALERAKAKKAEEDAQWDEFLNDSLKGTEKKVEEHSKKTEAVIEKQADEDDKVVSRVKKRHRPEDDEQPQGQGAGQTKIVSTLTESRGGVSAESNDRNPDASSRGEGGGIGAGSRAGGDLSRSLTQLNSLQQAMHQFTQTVVDNHSNIAADLNSANNRLAAQGKSINQTGRNQAMKLQGLQRAAFEPREGESLTGA